MSAPKRILASLKASIGDVVFGMEDGTVSIFGLVFGVAISTDDPIQCLSRAPRVRQPPPCP